MAFVHLTLAAILMAMPLPILRQPDMVVVEIEFAERPEPPPLEISPETEAEPIPPTEMEPAPDPVAAQVEPAPEMPEPRVPEPLTGESEVLTRLDAEPPTSTTHADTPNDTIDPAKVSQALRLLSCQSLTRAREADCPTPDPFAVADALEARDEAAHNPAAIPVFKEQNAAERFFARQKRNRHMFPGMDADLFGDTLPSGAYDAARIRSGREPLWSEDMKRGFTEPED